MHINFALVCGSAVVGFLVELTGMGGGALMTPMLVILFGVSPSAAISSDLVAALFMKPLGVAIHWRNKTVNTSLVRYLCYGSVPAALLGTYVMKLLGDSKSAEKHLELILGLALLVGGLAMVVRIIAPTKSDPNAPLIINRPLVIVIGAIGGFMVGLTSVGAGSMILILLSLIYPAIRSDQLVGTDLAQSIPLTAAATVGSLLFGHVTFALTLAIITGSVPAVIVGSLLSSRDFNKTLRPFIASVAVLSGCKYVGMPVHELAYVAVVLFVLAAVLAVRAHRLIQQAHEAANDITL